jgi:hypothetical protein
LRIIHVTPDGSQWDRPNNHNLFRVTLKSGDVWAVDPCSAQFGYTSPLSAWHNYEKHRTSKVNTVFEFGHTSSYLFESIPSLYQGFAELESSDWIAQRVEKRALAKMVDEYIPQEQAGKSSNMLAGSDGSFETAKQLFLERLEDHVKSVMKRLYSTEMLQKLRQEVDDEMKLVSNAKIYRY